MNQDQQPRKIALKLIAVIFVALLTNGCLMTKATVDLTNAVPTTCVDKRTGEKFSFDPKNITDAHIGLSQRYVEFMVVDYSGKKRKITSDMESFLECKPIGSAK